MMQAWAADSAGQAAGHQDSLFADPTFWVAVGFVLLFLAIGKKLYRVATLALDDRAETIKGQIEEARRLREEAQDLLASYQRKQREAVEEAASIADHAKAEAKRIGAKAAEDLEVLLQRREQQAVDRIARAEAEAVDEVRALAADLAVDTARRVLEGRLSSEKADQLIDAAIKELPDKLN